MATQTSGNLHLTKPAYTDTADIATINTNMDTIDTAVTAAQTAIANKVDKVSGKGLSTNDYTTAEKNKLAGVAANANNYSLPTASSSTLGGVKVGTNLSISSGVLSATDTTYSAATTSAAGLMSAADKTKLNGIATGATANVGTITGITMNGASKGTSGVVNLGTVITAHQDISGKVDKVSGKGLSTNDYTTAEKNKLAGVAANANNYSLPTASSSTLGGVKVGTNLSISSGVLSATDTTYSAATTSAAGLMSAADKTKLNGIATGATANTGTITGITMNGASKGTSGVVNLGTVITAHQDISGKVDKTNIAYTGVVNSNNYATQTLKSGDYLYDKDGDLLYMHKDCNSGGLVTAGTLGNATNVQSVGGALNSFMGNNFLFLEGSFSNVAAGVTQATTFSSDYTSYTGFKFIGVTNKPNTVASCSVDSNGSLYLTVTNGTSSTLTIRYTILGVRNPTIINP